MSHLTAALLAEFLAGLRSSAVLSRGGGGEPRRAVDYFSSNRLHIQGAIRVLCRQSTLSEITGLDDVVNIE
jgi:hypothetical protein